MINTLIKLALAETILKPLLISITKILIRRYLKPLYNKLDNNIQLPGNWEKFIQEPIEWIYNQVIQEETTIDKALLAELVIQEFNLKTFLSKTKNGR